LGNTEQPLQIPPTRAPRRRRVWPRRWRITAVVVVLALSIVGSSAMVNHEVSRRLATVPLATTTSVAPTTTVVVSHQKPQTLPRSQTRPDPAVAVEETTTTTVNMAQEVPQSAYDIITKLDALPVRDEHTLGYTRYRYGLWRDDDGDGCTTNYDVLIDEGDDVVSKTNPCEIVSGEWHSPYDDTLVEDPDAIVVDHVVGLYEAWKSGAYGWSDAQRNDYLNDVHLVQAALLAVSKQSQSNKAGRDPKDWLPGNAAFRCQYLQTWVDMKTAWKLSVDAGERESIAAAALNC
jgi:hypothetical protein